MAASLVAVKIRFVRLSARCVYMYIYGIWYIYGIYICVYIRIYVCACLFCFYLILLKLPDFMVLRALIKFRFHYHLFVRRAVGAWQLLRA